MKAFITGMAGFVGRHLVEYLLTHTDLTIHGTVYSEAEARRFGISSERIHMRQVNLIDREATAQAVREAQPDLVFHLAAQSFVPEAFRHPQETITNNIVAQLNLFSALLDRESLPRVLVIGSAEEYGLVPPAESPVRETNPLRPANPYAVSKIAQDFLGYQYWVSYRLPVVRVRPFNHIGPGQSDGFVVANFARQVAEIEKGLRPPVVQVGNLAAVRDFTDVRDMVRAYWLAINHGEPGEVYNLGSGTGHTIASILDTLIAQATCPIRVEQDPARLRPSDMPELVCDAGLFRALTGWTPEIDFRRTLSDILTYWRAVV